jgi:formylglycine-generating enzyme required for sulfatase activity
MDGLKWLAIVAASLASGFFWHKVSGNWAGAAVTAAGMAIVLRLVFNGEWLKALLALGAVFFLVFSLIGEGFSGRPTAPFQKKLVTPAAVGDAVPASGPAKGDVRVPKVGVVASAPQDGLSAVLQHPAQPGDAANGMRDCQDCPQLVVIPAGQFTMGADPKRGNPPEVIDPRETPEHRVSVPSFAAGRFAVTRGEFAAFVRATQYKTEAEGSGGCFAWSGEKWENHRSFHWRTVGFEQTDDHPVVCVSWNDAQAYVKWLGQVTRQPYRLLSESEREYATRAGTSTVFWWGETLSTDRANFDSTAPDYRGSHKGTTRYATVPVKSFDANPFGLYNVHGNVWEWVQDCQHDTYAGAPTDGSAWLGQCILDKHVLRGGAWAGDPAGLRASTRGWFTADFRFNIGGFRVARNLVSPK